MPLFHSYVVFRGFLTGLASWHGVANCWQVVLAAILTVQRSCIFGRVRYLSFRIVGTILAYSAEVAPASVYFLTFGGPWVFPDRAGAPESGVL